MKLYKNYPSRHIFTLQSYRKCTYTHIHTHSVCLLSYPLLTLFRCNAAVVICKYLPNDLHAWRCWYVVKLHSWKLWLLVSQFAVTIYPTHMHMYVCRHVVLCHKQNIANAAAAMSCQCCLFAIHWCITIQTLGYLSLTVPPYLALSW